MYKLILFNLSQQNAFHWFLHYSQSLLTIEEKNYTIYVQDIIRGGIIANFMLDN